MSHEEVNNLLFDSLVRVEARNGERYKRLELSIGKLTMKVSELTGVVTALANQLTKASAEINAQLEILRDAELPAEAVDAVNRIAAVTQALDDLNPDAVVPAPEEPAA